MREVYQNSTQETLARLRDLRDRLHTQWLMLCNSNLPNEQIRPLRLALETAEREAAHLIETCMGKAE